MANISEDKKRKLAGYIVMLALVIVAIAVAVILGGGSVTKRSGVRIGFVEISNSKTWNCRYVKFDGSLEKKLSFDTKELQVDVSTEGGEIALLIQDMQGNQLYKGNRMETCSFTVGINGPVKVTVTGKDHEGSFEIRAK